jgi:hypothetical protein
MAPFPNRGITLVRIAHPLLCCDETCPVLLLRSHSDEVWLELIVAGGEHLTTYLFGRPRYGGPPAFPFEISGPCSGLSLVETGLGWAVSPRDGTLSGQECDQRKLAARKAAEVAHERAAEEARRKPNPSWSGIFPNPGSPLGDNRRRMLEQGTVQTDPQ